MKRHFHATGQNRSERRFACAAQTDESDAPAPCLQIDAAEVLHQQTARLGQFGRGKTAKKLGRVHQVNRRFGAFEDQRLDWNVERPGNLPQQQNRDVALAGFELRQISLRDAGIARQQLAGHATPRPGFAHTLADQA
jgi:hypothetical protein